MNFGKGCHLHLIDGSAFIFRAYHALPPLTRKSDGLPVGAVAGFWLVIRPTCRGTFFIGLRFPPVQVPFLARLHRPIAFLRHASLPTFLRTGILL